MVSTREYLLQILLFACLQWDIDAAAVVNKKRAIKNGWTYDDPNEWPDEFPACGGEQQSPIDLDPSTAVETNYPKLTFVNYNKVFAESITNNGHTIMIKMPQVQLTARPFLEGGGLSDRYYFEQLHFHWGSDVSRGSEHRISNEAFPAELHIVHYNAKYGDFTTASQYPDGIAVLGIMIEVEARDNIAFRHIQQFDDVLDPTRSPIFYVQIPIPLEDLIPDDPNSFFRYNGSLTTPDCNESVIWTVFETPIAVSVRQLDKFRMVRDPLNRPLVDNFRPVQALNKRIVTYRKEKAFYRLAI